MNDERKAILNKLLEYFKENNINDFGYEKDKLISYEEAQILLDHITNLQNGFKSTVEELCETTEELEDYKSRNEKAIEYIKSLCYIESKNEWFTYGDDLSPEHIVNILNGDKDE